MDQYEEIDTGYYNHVGEEEEDPAAEFLAREQTQLAGLEDDNFQVVDGRGPAATDSGSDIFPESQMNENVEPPLPSSMTVLQNKPAYREEPEKIRKWRENQQEMLTKKDSEEEEKKGELRETANKEIEEWYARYKEQVEKAKLNNREASKNAEKEWIEERDAGSPEQDWERIARLCDFNPKSARSTKDTSRMRSIILQLKQAPPPQRVCS